MTQSWPRGSQIADKKIVFLNIVLKLSKTVPGEAEVCGVGLKHHKSRLDFFCINFQYLIGALAWL